MDLLLRPALRHNLSQEIHEVGTGVTSRRFPMNPSCLGVQRGIQRQRAVAVILESMALRAIGRQWQHDLPTIQSLNRGLFIHTKYGRNAALVIVDTTTPASPTLVSSTAYPDGCNGSPYIALQGTYPYVTCTDAVGSVAIFDISNPSAPSLLTTITDSTKLFSTSSVLVSGTYAYVTSANDDPTLASFTILSLSSVPSANGNGFVCRNSIGQFYPSAGACP
jgi:hypothetical protein